MTELERLARAIAPVAWEPSRYFNSATRRWNRENSLIAAQAALAHWTPKRIAAMTDKPNLDAIEARREAAMDVIRKLCNGTRAWIMRIPADPDYDPDLVIGAALKDNRDLTAALRAAWEEIERLNGIYESAVKGRSDFRQAYRRERDKNREPQP